MALSIGYELVDVSKFIEQEKESHPQKDYQRHLRSRLAVYLGHEI